MVSDEQIVKRIGELLADADLTTTTTSAIRRQLEQDFDIDLSDRKAFVRQQVDLYLESHPQSQQEEEDDAGKHGGEDSEAVKVEDAEPVQEDENSDVEEEDEEEEDEEEEEEELAKKPEQDSKRLQAKIDRAKKDSLQKEKKKRAAGGGFTKLCQLSPELQAVTGEKEMARTQVVKSLWVYIRAKNLQDPGNKRKILCDDRLQAVFATKSIDMFKMNKLLTKHIWPLDSLGDEGDVKTKRPKIESEDEGESKTKRPKVEKREAPEKEGGKAKGGGFTAPLPLSEALVEFFGTGESELSRSEVVKRMWAYIKENKLQDPADKRQILCDSKLKELFGCETFTGFIMTKHLSPHFLKS
eukprot:c14883_g1_i1 orf=519-1583(-)